MSTAPADPLVRLAKAVSWLDSARWTGGQPDNPALRFVEDAEAGDRILAHWLTYVTDRMRSWEDVWYRGGFVFSRVAADYAREKPRPGAVGEFLASYRTPAALGEKMWGWRLPMLNDITAQGPPQKVKDYRSRYPDDDKSIYRTLWLLAHLGWSLVDYLKGLIRELGAQQDALRRIAQRLDILTYRLSIAEDEALSLLSDEEALAKDFLRWNPKAHADRKRLWAALRDYRKAGRWHDYLQDCGVFWPNENFDLAQLELPGDVWNERFFKHLVQPLAAKAGIEIVGSAPVLARRIYDVVRRVEPGIAFYPEQFDVSFDFAQRMCDRMACWCCPFWRRRPPFSTNPIELCHREQGQPCAVLLITSGYLVPGESGCPFCQGLVDGLCDGVIRHLVPACPDDSLPQGLHLHLPLAPRRHRSRRPPSRAII